MGRICTICSHPDSTAINREALNNVAYRRIALKHKITDASLKRHMDNCLKFSPSAVDDANKDRQTIDVLKEFAEQLEFAKKLRVAAEQYLSDPLDPLKMNIIARADEIDVAYFDHTDLTNGNGKEPQPKRKTGKLSMLLQTVEAMRNIEVDKINIKHYDLRKFALDAINTTDTCIDKFARMGNLYKDREGIPKELLEILIMIIEREFGIEAKGRIVDAIEVETKELTDGK